MAFPLRCPPTIITARLANRHRPPPSSSSSNTLMLPPFKNTKSSNSLTSLHCDHFNSCSGCSHELDLDNPHVLQEAAKFFGDLGVSDFSFDACKLWEWRCRAKLAVRGSSKHPLIGLYQEGTHNVVDIPQCRAHHPRINAAVELLKQGICTLNIQPYDEDCGSGDLRYIQLAVTTYDTSLPASERYLNGKVQVTLVWNSRSEQSESFEKLNSLAEFMWRTGGPNSSLHIIHSIWANFQTSSSNIIFGNRWRHLLGDREFWEHIGGVDLSIDPSSFAQANTQEPLHWLKGTNVVIVDPPRKGLHSSVGEALNSLSTKRSVNKTECPSSKVKEEKRPWILRAREASVHVDSKADSETSHTWPNTLIYISCGWESFKEDCSNLLSTKVWFLEKAHAFNFFPGTQSIEVLAVFKRGPRISQKKKKTGKKKKKSK